MTQNEKPHVSQGSTEGVHCESGDSASFHSARSRWNGGGHETKTDNQYD